MEDPHDPSCCSGPCAYCAEQDRLKRVKTVSGAAAARRLTAVLQDARPTRVILGVSNQGIGSEVTVQFDDGRELYLEVSSVKVVIAVR